MATTREYMSMKLKEFRNAKGLRVDEVGEIIGKSGKTISAWEVGRGQPDADMLMRLCSVYEVNISDFYPQEDSSALTLSNDEVELVSCYRALASDERSFVLRMLRGLAEG